MTPEEKVAIGLEAMRRQHELHLSQIHHAAHGIELKRVKADEPVPAVPVFKPEPEPEPVKEKFSLIKTIKKVLKKK